MDLVAMLSEIKDHFDHGGQLAQSHLPALLHIGGVIGADPLVQAAINTALSVEGKALVTDLLGRLEALEQAHAAGNVTPAGEALDEPVGEPA